MDKKFAKSIFLFVSILGGAMLFSFNNCARLESKSQGIPFEEIEQHLAAADTACGTSTKALESASAGGMHIDGGPVCFKGGTITSPISGTNALVYVVDGKVSDVVNYQGLLVIKNGEIAGQIENFKGDLIIQSPSGEISGWRY